MDHKNKLGFPNDKIISKEAKEIISQFLTDTLVNIINLFMLLFLYCVNSRLRLIGTH